MATVNSNYNSAKLTCFALHACNRIGQLQKSAGVLLDRSKPKTAATPCWLYETTTYGPCDRKWKRRSATLSHKILTCFFQFFSCMQIHKSRTSIVVRPALISISIRLPVAVQATRVAGSCWHAESASVNLVDLCELQTGLASNQDAARDLASAWSKDHRESV